MNKDGNKNRNYYAVSVKHTECKWKFGMPLVFWGKRTKDDEQRCFSGYTSDPSVAELYALGDFKEKGHYPDWIKDDEAVPLSMDFCKKWEKYDTVLVDAEMAKDYYYVNGITKWNY